MWIWVLALLTLSSSTSILVLTDSNQKSSHSSYFDHLKKKGYSLTFRKASSPQLKFQQYGQFLYDNIILMAPSTQEIGRLQTILEFYDQKGNILLFGATDAGFAIRKLANHFGFDFYQTGTRVYLKDNPEFSANTKAPSVILSSSKPVLYQGIGLHLKKNSTLSSEILLAPQQAYSQNPITLKKSEQASILLGGISQGRNNNRFGILGSISVCSNDLYEQNKEFCQDLTSWVLSQKGVLRYKNISHHLKTQNKPVGYKESQYTIKDHIQYEIVIEELKNGKWIPFKSDEVYLEFVMLDPRIRVYLKEKNGKYSTDFVIPDQHGVYQFKTKFNQIGYTWISTADKVSVRHLRHDQYPRFLLGAYPYYASVFSCIIGFLFFTFFFIYHKDNK